MNLQDFKWHYMNLSGRIGRKKYWLFYFVPCFFVGALFEVCRIVYGDDLMRFFLPFMTPILFMLLCGFVKRQHDLGKSGWWILIGVIPYVGLIYNLIYLGCVKGEIKDNKYGKTINRDELGA